MVEIVAGEVILGYKDEGTKAAIGDMHRLAEEEKALAQVGQAARDQLKAQAEALKSLRAAYAGMAPEIRAMASASERASRDSDLYTKSLNRFADVIGGRGLKQEVGALAVALQQAGGASKLTGPAFDFVAQKALALQQAGAKLPPALQSIVSAQGQAAASSAQMGGAMSMLQGQAQGLASGLGPVGSALSAIGPAGLAFAAGIAVVGGAAGAVGSFLVSAAQSAIAYGSAVTDSAGRSGTLASTFQELTFAASQGGQGVGALEGAITKMQDALGSSPQAFANIGLSASALAAKNPGKAFEDVAAALAKIPNEAARTQAAIDIFGRGGAAMLPFIEGLERAQARARELGIVMDESTIAALDKTGDAAAEVTQAWDGLIRNIGAAIATTPGLAEGLSAVATALGDLSRTVIENKEEIQELATAGFQAFYTVLTGGQASLKGVVADLHTVTAAIHNVAAGYALAKEKAAAFFGAGGTAAGAGAAAGGPAPAFKQQALSDVGTVEARDRAALAAVAARKKAIADLAKAEKEYISDITKGMAAYFDQLARNRAAREGGLLADDEQNTRIEIGRIAQEIEDAGGASALTASQLAKVSAELQKLKAQSPEAFADAAKTFGAVVNDASVDILKTRGNMFSQVKAGLSPVVREIGTVKKETMDWDKALQNVAAAFEVLGISADSALGRVLGGITAGAQALKSLDFKNAQGGFSLTGGKGFGGLLSNITGGIQAASAAIGIGKAIFGLFHSSPAEKAAKQAGAFIGTAVSKEMGEKIAKNAKALGISIHNAVKLALPDLMRESGKAATTFVPQILDLMNAVKSGAVPAAEGMKALNDSFAQLADEAGKAKLGSLELFRVMQQARSQGLVTDDMREAMSAAVAAMGESLKKTGGLKIVDEDSAREQATIFALVWTETVAQKGLVEASRILTEQFGNLQKRLEESGFAEAAAAIFGPIATQMALATNEAFAGAADAAVGFSEILKEAINTAIPITIEQFAAFQGAATDAFEQAKAAGIDAGLSMEESQKQALLAVAPLLQQLVQAAAAYGFELDAGTKALIEQAKAQGVAFQTSPIDRAANALERLVGIFEQVYGLASGTADEFERMGGAIPGGGGVTPLPGRDVPNLAAGDIVMPRPGGVVRRLAEAGQAELAAPVRSFADYILGGFAKMLAQQPGSASGGSVAASVSTGDVNLYAVAGGGSSPGDLDQFAKMFRRMLQANTQDAATLLERQAQAVARREVRR